MARENEKTVEERAEENRIRRANRVLAEIDQILENMIDEIIIQRDEEVASTGVAGTIVDGEATNRFKRKINALRINGDENILIAINDKYDKAISSLKNAMREEDISYKAQFKNELDKIMANKTERFDSIAETYKELSDRLERGEVQRDYYQDKADKKQAEIDVKEDFYKEKIGNADKIAVSLEPELEKIAEKDEVQKKYQRLLKLNADIERIENDLRDPDLEDEEKEKLETKLEKLKKERKEAVEEFSKTAKDKDGNKYEKEDGKSDKDYINELDASRIQEAIDNAVQVFNDKIGAMDPAKRKITLLDKNLNENGDMDISGLPVSDYKSANQLLDVLATQKKLWQAKMERDGFDKAKLKREKQELQERANSYDDEAIRYEDGDGNKYNYPIQDEKFSWRHPIRSIKAFFQRKKHKKTINNEFDIVETKKEALKYLEKNKDDLAEINLADKKRDKDKFMNNLRHNVSVSEQAVNKFWDRDASKDKSKDDEGRY